MLTPRDALRRAIQLQNAGNLAGAEQLCRAVLRAEPRNPDALNLLGVLALRRGDARRAEQLIGEAIRLHPRAASYHHNLAQALGAQNRLDAAVEAYGRAASIAPDDPARHEALAAAQRANRQTEAAIASCRRVLELAPGRPRAHVALGDALQDAEDFTGAVEAYERAIDLAPDDASAYNNLGGALQKLGDIDSAAAAYERAVVLKPGAALYHLNLGVLRLMQLDPAAALAAFDSCLAIDPFDRRGVAYRAIAAAELGVGDGAAAQAELDAIVPVHLDPPPGWTSIADFDRDLARDLMRHRSLRWEPAGTATTGGADILLLLQHPTPTISAFEQMLRAAIDRHFARLLPVPGHPFLDRIPVTYDLDIWGTVLQAQGYQAAHIHPTGWMSGVYYVQLPDSLGSGGHNRDFSGWIEFGRPSDNFPVRREPPVRLMRPEEGAAFFFPSYIYHRTIPFDGPKPRISIAFDIRPLEVRRAAAT